MKRKWICAGLLLALLVTGTCIFNMVQKDDQEEPARQEASAQKPDIAIQKEDTGSWKEEQTQVQEKEKDKIEMDCRIVEAEALKTVEDWADAEESFVIENEGFKDETSALCGISENKIYYCYSVSDDENDGLTLVYNMYDRKGGETKKLYELAVRDVVFRAIYYNEHMYILDVKVPSYRIWDVSANGAELFAEGECKYYPELQLSGSRLLVNVYQGKGNEVTCILSWVDLRSEKSGVIQMKKYEENTDTGNVSGAEISNIGGWGDGAIYETFSYEEEPRNTYDCGDRDYGEQELWYYDFATGKATRQELTLGQHSYYVGGDENYILIDRASTSEPLPNSGTIYERIAGGYVSRIIPEIEATNSIAHTQKMANGQIIVECREGFLLIDMDKYVCTGEKTFNFCYSDTEIAYIDNAGTVHVRKYVDGAPSISEETDKDSNEINIHVDSPNHRYRAETIGEENLGGRRYPSTMRVVDLQTNSVLWEETAYLDTDFLWSPDSRYLSIAYSGRTWRECKVIDSSSWQEVPNINIREIQTLSDNLPSIYENGTTKVNPIQWKTACTLLLEVYWDTPDGNAVVGTVLYHLDEQKYENFTWELKSIG